MKISFIDKRAVKEFEAFPPDMAADFSHTVMLMQQFGNHNLGLPHARKLSGTTYGK